MANDQLVTWLNDAYAMEQGLIRVLQSHANDARAEMPEAARRIEQHISETQTHASRIEQCLKMLGTTPSTVKSAISVAMGTIEGASTGLFRDAPIKNALADYGAEQFEVGCYRALSTAARYLGEENVAELCELNLFEDEAMARWLREQIPMVVKKSLAKLEV